MPLEQVVDNTVQVFNSKLGTKSPIAGAIANTVSFLTNATRMVKEDWYSTYEWISSRIDTARNFRPPTLQEIEHHERLKYGTSTSNSGSGSSSGAGSSSGSEDVVTEGLRNKQRLRGHDEL